MDCGEVQRLWVKGLGYVSDKHVYKFKDFSDFHQHSDLSSINKITKFNCNNILNQQTISSLKNKISEDSKVFYFIKNPRLTNIYIYLDSLRTENLLIQDLRKKPE